MRMVTVSDELKVLLGRIFWGHPQKHIERYPEDYLFALLQHIERKATLPVGEVLHSELVNLAVQAQNQIEYRHKLTSLDQSPIEVD